MDLLAKVLVLNSVKFCLKLIHWRLSTLNNVYVLFVPKPQNSLKTPYLGEI